MNVRQLEHGRHRIQLNDADVTRIADALMVYHAVLTIKDGAGADQLKTPADHAAKIHSRIQRHSKGLCDCAPPTLGGTHS